MLVKGWRRLLLTVSAFTLAHSITLGLATAGILQINSTLVETLIALSIAFLAKEILLAQRGRTTWASRWPWGISFGFGLIHGLGLILFLVLWLLGAAVLWRIGLRKLPVLRPVLPYALGIIAMFWFLERLFGEWSAFWFFS